MNSFEREICESLTPYREAIYLTQHRLSQSLSAALQDASPRLLRRLGSLLLKAAELIESIETDRLEATLSAPLPQLHHPPSRAASLPISMSSTPCRISHHQANNAAAAQRLSRSPSPRQQSYEDDDDSDQQQRLVESTLAADFDSLLRDMARGQALLEHHKQRLLPHCAHVPLCAIGAQGIQTVSQWQGRRHEQWVLQTLPQGGASAAATSAVPPAVKMDSVTAPSLPKATSDPGSSSGDLSSSASYASRPTNSIVTSSTDGAADGDGEGAEAVMSEVSHLLSQLKDHAVQMSEWMRGEDRAALSESEALLSHSLTQSKENQQHLDQVIHQGAPRAPQLIRRIPGGALLWDQLVAPLWEVLKLVFTICLLLSITASVMLIIVMRSKPQIFEARQQPATILSPVPSLINTSTSASGASSMIDSGRITDASADVGASATVPFTVPIDAVIQDTSLLCADGVSRLTQYLFHLVNPCPSSLWE